MVIRYEFGVKRSWPISRPVSQDLSKTLRKTTEHLNVTGHRPEFEPSTSEYNDVDVDKH
jgi:hypothetical protein